MKVNNIFIFSVLGYLLAIPSLQAETLPVIGWIEHVQIQARNIILKAKIDTGADNSSIHADNIQVYDKDGATWVRFTLRNKENHSADFDLPLVRYAKIKRKRAEPLLRPVVSMGLCIGNNMKKVDINLANREHFKYRMLIGRSYLKDQYLVDSSKQHTIEPDCNTLAGLPLEPS